MAADDDPIPWPSPAQRTGVRASTTMWVSPNRFARCLSLQVIGARNLPPSNDLSLTLKAGGAVHEVYLLLSKADITAGGGGRLDGGRMSDRIDILLERSVLSVAVHLVAHVPGRWWSSKTVRLVAQCPFSTAPGGEPASVPPEWFKLLNAEAVANREDDALRSSSWSGGPPSPDKGPALLLRIQCFDAEDLEEAESRERLFQLYSASGLQLTPSECDRMLADVARGYRPVVAAEEPVEEEEARTRDLCHLVIAQLLAAFGNYKPDLSLRQYVLYYHTLFWVVCRAAAS